MPSPDHRASPLATRNRAAQLESDLIFDLAADNAQLRAALTAAEGAGVRRELITQELTHRIGNLLAVVGAIARKTLQNTDPVAVKDFTARLNALAAAQRILIDSETSAAMLADVVTAALAAHVEDRLRIAGPDVQLDGRRAHALTLALHELATNAAKYGALSVDGGWVEVEWSDAGGQLDFHWRERGGPAVTTPTRSGFGSQLITINLGAAFSGEVTLNFDTSGVECRLQAATQPAV